jgi:hypothetical protein
MILQVLATPPDKESRSRKLFGGGTIFDGDFAEEVTDIGNLALNSFVLVSPLADNTLALASLELCLVQRLCRLKHLPRNLKIILLLLAILVPLAVLALVLLVLCVARKGDCGGRFGGFGACCYRGGEDLLGIFTTSV